MLRRRIAGWALLAGWLAPVFSFGQTITTVVGNAINDNRPALQTPLVRPQGLAFDNNGNLIIADRGQFVIRRVNSSTLVSTVLAGGGSIFDDAIPVPGATAGLDYPKFLDVAADNSIYFSDVNNNSIRKITPTGLVTTVAGTGYYGYYGDGDKATLADLAQPTGVAVDRPRNLLYFSDTGNYVVRRVNLNTGIIDTVVGTGDYGYSGDGGPANLAKLANPWGLAVDAAGNLYITDEFYNPARADYYDDVVRKVTITNGVVGIIATFVPDAAGLSGPAALAFDPAGNLHVADYYNYRVVRVEAGGSLTTVAGGGNGADLPRENVLATSEYLYGPSGLAFDSTGNLYVSEEGWGLVRRVDASTKLVRSYAGTLSVLDGGPAISAPLAFPLGIAAAANGSYYIADTDHNRIRRVDANGTIQSVVGNGIYDSAPDGGLANGAAVASPISVALDNNGNLLYTEASSVVRRLNVTTGVLSTVAGTAFDYGYSGDNGPASSALLANPSQAVAAPNGDVYISDRDNHCIRRVSAGIITTVAGICSPDTEGGYSGDGGPALQAKLSYPTGLAFDQNGNLLIADSNNSVVRLFNVSTGIITRVAGIPQSYGYSGDFGSPLDAELGSPTGLAVDRTNGNLYISDEYNNAIRLIRNGRIYTLAGIGAQGFFGDGDLAQFAWLNLPEGLAVDNSGNLLIVDSNNNRVRKVTLAGLQPPTLSVTPASLTFRVQADGEEPPAQFLRIRNTGAGFLTWEIDTRLPSSGGSGTFTGGKWLYAVDFDGSAPSYDEISVDPTVVQTAGTYQGQIVINAPGSNNSPATIPITLIVDPPVTPQVALSTRTMYFEAVQGGASPPSKILTITNRGSGTLDWEASFFTFRGENWLGLSSTSGSTKSGGAASTAAITTNPAGLIPGFYVGLVTVTNLSDGAETSVLVGLSVGTAAGTIFPTATSFVFYAVQGGTYVPPQTFRILNTGQGIINWQVQSTVSQGNWLRFIPASGSSDAASPGAAPTVTVAVDPAGLSQGTYGGYLTIQSAGARNTPQLANVILRVLPPGSPPVAQVQPAGLVFSGNAGALLLPQEVTAQTTGGKTLNFTVGTRTQNGGPWLTASPSAGSLASSSDRPKIRVQAAPGTLAAGTYRGTVTVSFSDGTGSEVSVAMILRPAGTTTQGFGEKEAVCSPAEQVIVSTRLGNNFALPTGWPTTVIAAVTNNCGLPVTNSTVAVNFSNGDGSIILQSQGDGIYVKDWVPTKITGASTSVQVTMRAVNPLLPESTLQLTGTLSVDNTNPVVADTGIVNAASLTSNRPVAPGSIVTIFGSDLASSGTCFGGNCADSLPLPTTLGGVSVRMGGFNAPLFFASPGQVNAQVPVELSNVTSADVVVTARGLVSTPRTLQIDANQPGIFVIGGSQGAVLNENLSSNSPARPAVRGSVIQIFATGLGPTTPAVASGAAAPSSPTASLVTPVTVTIGGINAPVQFQALAPGFVGIYQINAQVPANVAAGSAINLKITQNGVDSNEVTVAIN